MVHIPTTQRQFYNTEPKVNNLSVSGSALLPATQQYKQTLVEQQKIKIDTNAIKARVEIDALNNQWRLKNQAVPDNPEAKQQLQTTMREILNDFGNDIDSVAKMEWDTVANKLISAYEISNNEWALRQRAANTKLDVAENINANLQLAQNAGRSGNLGAGLADYVNSYNQLFEYAAHNMGETEARQLLNDYEEDYMGSFIMGLAETDPQAAMEALKQPEIAASFKKEGGTDVMMKIVKKQIALQDFQQKISQYNMEKKLSDNLDNLSAADGLKILDENKMKISKKYYEAKQKALLSDLGITAETRAEEASSIILDIAAVSKNENKINEYYQEMQNILTKIEEKYAAGMLSSADRKRLINEISRGQGKNIENLKKNTNNAWLWWGFSYKDADEFIRENYNGKDSNRLLLDYFRAVNDGKEYDGNQKKEILQGLIDKEKGQKLNSAFKRQIRVGSVYGGYRYIGGDLNNQNSWEKAE